MKIHNSAVIFLAAALVVLTLDFATVHAQSASGDNAVETRARQFAQAISSGDPEKLKQLVTQDFGPDLQRIPMSAHISNLMMQWDTSRGLAFVDLTKTQPFEGVARFKNTLTGAMTAIWFQVESQAPHRIIGIGPKPASMTSQHERGLTQAEIARELGAFMSRLAEADTFAGAVLLAKDGRIVFQQAYGLADKNFSVPAALDTQYNIASMGKMFTAVAIAQLVEQGKLSYEDSLSKFIGDFPNPQAAQKIRIKHLLAHSAGLGMWWGPRYATSMTDFRTVDDLLKWAAIDEKDVAFEPGTKFQYSNTGYVVLGKVIEVVTGQSYFDYVREHIYRPAGMTNTNSYESEPIAQRLAVGYNKTFDANGKVVFQSNLGNQRGPLRGSPAGGSFSTVGDLFNFSQALRSGKLLKPENLRLLVSPKPEFHSESYGYGFDVNEGRHTAGHAGGTVGVSNNFEMFLDSGWTAIVLANYTMFMFEPSLPMVEKMRELVQDSEPLQHRMRRH